MLFLSPNPATRVPSAGQRQPATGVGAGELGAGRGVELERGVEVDEEGREAVDPVAVDVALAVELGGGVNLRVWPG